MLVCSRDEENTTRASETKEETRLLKLTFMKVSDAELSDPESQKHRVPILDTM